MGLPVVVEVEPDHVEVRFVEGLGGGQQVVGRLANDVLDAAGLVTSSILFC